MQPDNAASLRDAALYDAQEYLIAGPANQAEWWEHLGDAHRDYAALAQAAVRLEKIEAAARRLVERYERALREIVGSPIATNDANLIAEEALRDAEA